MITRHLYRLKFELVNGNPDREKGEILYVLDRLYYITEEGNPGFGTYDEKIFQRNRQKLFKKSFKRLKESIENDNPMRELEAMSTGDPRKPTIDFITNF